MIITMPIVMVALGVLKKSEREILEILKLPKNILRKFIRSPLRRNEFHEDSLALTWVDLGLGRSNWT